ncbi:peptidase S8/S53 domain-containing protein [Syncephalis fuscata]|nr:peptidase S8/S53 domain-containing protein [Syncephalis fuscata]
MVWINSSSLEAVLLLTIAVGTLSPQTSAADIDAIGQEEQYIFSLKRGAEKTAAFEQIRPLIRQRRSLNWPDRQVFTGKLNSKQAEQLSQHPAVQSIELDQRINVHDLMPQIEQSNSTTTVPMVRRANPAMLQDGLVNWGLERIWQREVVAHNRYEYPVTAGTNVHVYIIDSGIAVDHPEFEGRATFDVNFVNDEPAQDLDGHGTHVAGIVGGSNHGVAKKAKIHAVKVLNADGVGFVSDVVRGLLYVARATPTSAKSQVINKNAAANNKSAPLNTIRPRNVPTTSSSAGPVKAAASNSIRVANLSLHTGRSTFLNDAVTFAFNSGVVVVAASGNTASDACDTSPASSGHVISVGAVDRADRLASFSAFGRCVNILAPGVNIASTWKDKSVQILSGTSMASPFVAGAAALYLGEKQYNTPQEVVDEIVSHATNLRSGLIRADTPGRILYSLPY